MKKVTSCFLFLLVCFPVFGATVKPEIYTQRRAAVMERMGDKGMLILFSSAQKKFTGDVFYKFRQENNLYYLTGIKQEETVLVLMPSNKTRKENLFILNRDSSREVWAGSRLSAEEAQKISGIENVYSRSEFDDFIDSLLYGRPYGVNRYLNTEEYARFFSQLKFGDVPIFLLLEDRPGLRGQLSPEFEFANKLRERFPGIIIRDCSDILASLRLIKSAEEIDRIRRAIDITSEGLLDAMRKMEPGMLEYEIQAIIEFHYLKNDAAVAYPSIIASGNNATTLHYDRNARKAAGGDLVLMDVGAEYGYYAADVTRTVPVNGKFTPAQADIYQVVLSAQEEAMKVLRPGNTIQQVHERAVEGIKAGLLKLGLITDPNTDQYRNFFMHGTSHWLGLDVHDVGERSTPFQSGMVLTIEPGIYVRGDLLENLARDGKNQQWIEAIRPAFEKYRGVGVRIEDDFLITADGYEHLSRRVPRHLRDVERWMQSNKPRSARAQ